MSRPIRRMPLRLSGTSRLTIRWASPSAMAVLPTPASPMSTGLFLVRRESTCSTRRISSSRPITGSSFPASARAVKSLAYFSREANFSSARSSSTRAPLRDSRMAASSFFRSRPKRSRSFFTSVWALAKASSMASVDRKRSPRPRPVSEASSRKLRMAGPAWGSAPPMALGR